MISFKFLRAAMLLIGLSYALNATAQTKIWGAGAAVGQAEGEFQNPFANATSTGNYSNNDWTALSVFDNNGNTTPGAAFWTRSTLGYSQGAYWAGTTPINSPSQANGVAIFDADFLDNNGVAGAFGTGSSPAAHRGELISPKIDLSAYAGMPLVIEFYAFYRLFQDTELSVAMSTDDGLTWSTPYDYRLLLGDLTAGLVRVPMFDITSGGGILTDCRIKFIFENNYYFSIVDDVNIQIAPDYDISMAAADPDGASVVEAGDFVKIGGDAYIAIENLFGNDLSHWVWGAKLINRGAQNFYPQDSAYIMTSVDYVDNFLGNITPNVYLDTIYVDTLLAGDAVGSLLMDNLRDLNFLINNRVGRYRIRYWVGHKHTDANPINDTIDYTFHVTHDYLSKARRSGNDGRVFASTSAFPSGGSLNAYEYGSVYYFPTGCWTPIGIDSIEFRYQLPFNYVGDTSKNVIVNIYDLQDGRGSVSANGVLNPEDLLQIGIAAVPLNGLGTTVSPGSFGLGVANTFVDPGQGNAMAPLTRGRFYYISVAQLSALDPNNAPLTDSTALWVGEDQHNYAHNVLISNTTGTVFNPSPMSRTDAVGNTSWFWAGFGLDRVPSIGIYTKGCNSSTTLLPNPTSTLALEIYPNPTTDIINLNLKGQPEDEPVTFILTDLSGRVVQWWDTTDASLEQSINVTQLPAGAYLLTAQTATSTITKRLLKR